MIKRVVVLLILLVRISLVQGQNTYDMHKIIPPSPTAAAFARYGDIPVDISTGVPDIEIPLYTITSRSLSIPLALSYHASGIRVNDISTPVGLGWVLKGMGVVSRTILDRPDEETAQFGLLMGGKAKYIYKKDYDDALATVTNYITNYNLGFDLYKDMTYHDKQADRFNYQLPNGKSGIFRHDFTTQDFSPQHCITTPYIPIVINWNNGGASIKDENGVNYYFSKGYGSEQPLNVCASHYNESCSNGSPNTSWYLTSMQSADGSDEIDYEYADETNDNTIASYMQSVSWGLLTTNQLGQFIQQSPGAIADGGNVSLITTHDPMLTKITTATTIVTFQYSKDRKDWVNNSRLASIKIYDKLSNNLIKEIDLSNDDYFGDVGTNGSSRLKLDNVSIKGMDASLAETYSFGYNGGSLPPYANGTNFGGSSTTYIANFSQDYWGYYNGANNAGLIPVEYYPNYWSYGMYPGRFGGNRRPDPTYGSMCMLNSMTYPTGGTTNFTFEPNYSNDVYQGYWSASTGNAGNVGGFRVKSITSSAGNGSTIIKTYDYAGGGVVPHPLTGNLFSYYQQYIGGGDPSSCDVLLPSSGYGNTFYRGTIQSSSFSPLAYTNGAIIVYPNVTVYEGGGKTDYTYQIPEEYPTNQTPMSAPQDINWSNIYGQYWYDNGSYQPQLLNKSAYKNDNGQFKLVNRTDNTYQYYRDLDFSTGVNMVHTSYDINNLGQYIDYEYQWGESCPGQSLNQYPYQFSVVDTKVAQRVSLLTKGIETDYDPNGNSLITSKSYEYANTEHLLPTKITATNSKNELLVTELKYPHDFIYQSPYDEMVNRHVWSPVIEQTSYKNSNFLQATRTNYNYWDGSSWTNSITNLIVPQTVDTRNQINPNYETRLRYHAYDDKGDVLMVSKEYDARHSYLWGYNKTYPVAEVVGADYNTISQYVDPNVLNNPTDDNQIRNTLNSLRTSLSGSNAQVTTLTYKPLVGMTSKTDPAGRTTYYEYDNFSRLKLIRDQDNNILKKYCYNYAGQAESCTETVYSNNVQSGALAKNDCASGYTGSSVNYYIPSNTYFSSISVADANQKAMDAAQAYVNANGTCTLISNNIYAKMTLENVGQYADLVIRFYSDANGTIPVSVSNITVNYSEDTEDDLSGEHQSYSYSATCNGESTTIAYSVPLFTYLYESGVYATIYHYYSLGYGTPDTAYIPL